MFPNQSYLFKGWVRFHLIHNTVSHCFGSAFSPLDAILKFKKRTHSLIAALFPLIAALFPPIIKSY